MSWPSTAGELLPRADEARRVREKLGAYSLNPDHEQGRAKAAAFLQILGITAADVDYLTTSLLDGVRRVSVTGVRDNAPYGYLCEVLVPVRGLRDKAGRVSDVLTAWEVRHEDDAPRLVTAYIGG